MDDSQAMARLKASMERIQTSSQLYALIVDYTYVEILEAYRQLTPQRQAQLAVICDRDTQRQLTAVRNRLAIKPSSPVKNLTFEQAE